MSEPPIQTIAETPAAAVADPSLPARTAKAISVRWGALMALVFLVLGLVSVTVAWQAQRRVGSLQQELVRRQQDSQTQANEAMLLAKQSHEGTREITAKVALLEARLAEVAVQRSQLEELIQSLSRARDENLLVDLDSGIRVATQQAAIMGTAEPLVAALKHADERLARYNQPRLEGVRRAIARDIDRVKGVSMADIPSLSIKLDEAVRLIDELPLLSAPEPAKPAAAVSVKVPQSAAAGKSSLGGWVNIWNEMWTSATQRVWSEVKALVRVTHIDYPEAMLVAPEQAFLIRENLKLRLLNVRIALLSQQFDVAQGDLQQVQSALERYFDRSSHRVTLTTELIKRVSAQARQRGVPRPDDTLAALATASAGR